MKIGILTFSSAHNFGAILQCYGLYSTLRSLGHDVHVIDYRPDYLATYEPKFGLRQFISRDLLGLPERWRTYRYWRNVYNGYIRFKTCEMRMSEPVYDHASFAKIIERFDYIVVGSDQVWNPKFNGLDNVWFGEPHQPGIKWITYAASAGNPENLKFIPDLRRLLNNFRAISVRETDLSAHLSATFGLLGAKTVIDPSLLPAVEAWRKWTKPIEKDNYVLTYQARESNDVFRIAESIASNWNARIIPLDFYGNVDLNGYKTRITSPGEFISLVKNARCVVTTSFHGTAFSIILKTPFYTLRLNDGADNRAADLLESLGLIDRMIDCHDTPVFEIANFEEAHKKLEKMRRNSIDYLKEALS